MLTSLPPSSPFSVVSHTYPPSCIYITGRFLESVWFLFEFQGFFSLPSLGIFCVQFRILEYYERHGYFVDVYNQMGGVVKANERYKSSTHKSSNSSRKQLKNIRVVLIAGNDIWSQTVNLTNVQRDAVGFVCNLANFAWVVDSDWWSFSLLVHRVLGAVRWLDNGSFISMFSSVNLPIPSMFLSVFPLFRGECP